MVKICSHIKFDHNWSTCLIEIMNKLLFELRGSTISSEKTQHRQIICQNVIHCQTNFKFWQFEIVFQLLLSNTWIHLFQLSLTARHSIHTKIEIKERMDTQKKKYQLNFRLPRSSCNSKTLSLETVHAAVISSGVSFNKIQTYLKITFKSFSLSCEIKVNKRMNSFLFSPSVYLSRAFSDQPQPRPLFHVFHMVSNISGNKRTEFLSFDSNCHPKCKLTSVLSQ